MYCMTSSLVVVSYRRRTRSRKSTVLLPAFELRRPLLAERLDALAEIVRRAEQAVREAFELEAQRERAVVNVVEDALRHPEGERRELRELGDHPFDGLVQLVRGNDLGDQTPGEGV